jgi:uncharacterized protein YqjF (DUF2071 family)
MSQPFLTASWRHLLMINYEVDAGVLRPFVPRGTEIDLWNGRTFLSVVGFQFLDTRVHGLAIPGHRNFPEVNLRFYIMRKDSAGVRRGVAFIQELVPRRVVALVARWVYNENYHRLPMQQEVQPPDPPKRHAGIVAYRWRANGRSHAIEADIAGEPSLAAAGSEPWFITEHYWGYARQRNGTTLEYQVEHPPWRVWQPTQVAVDPDLATYYGSPFTDALRQAPSSAFVADGSEVSVYPGRPLD